MSMIEQVHTVAAQQNNALHQLSLKRMQARKDADSAFQALHRHVQNTFTHPVESTGFIGVVIKVLPTLITGITMGRKIIARIRG